MKTIPPQKDWPVLFACSDADLAALLHYQTRPVSSVVTMGFCANGCGKGARGGGVCEKCIEREIERREQERVKVRS